MQSFVMKYKLLSKVSHDKKNKIALKKHIINTCTVKSVLNKPIFVTEEFVLFGQVFFFTGSNLICIKIKELSYQFGFNWCLVYSGFGLTDCCTCT